VPGFIPVLPLFVVLSFVVRGCPAPYQPAAYGAVMVVVAVVMWPSTRNNARGLRFLRDEADDSEWCGILRSLG
jgi:hypothetical protein